MNLQRIDAIIRVRRGPFWQWADMNPILDEGEISFVTAGQNARRFKIGDGITRWNDLEFTASIYPEDILSLYDQEAEKELPTNGNTLNLLQKIRNALLWVFNQFDMVFGHRHNGGDSPRVSYADLSDTNIIESFVENKVNNEASARISADENINNRIDSLENLGRFIGSFDTFNDLPANTSYFEISVFVNNFATVINDEAHNGLTTRYIITEISEYGDITWEYNMTYNTDVSGKQDAIIATGVNNVLTAPDTIGGQPGTRAIGTANGIATLGEDGRVPYSQLPDTEFDISTIASTTTPLMDGTATVGNENAFSRGNHRHPSDLSRAGFLGNEDDANIINLPIGSYISVLLSPQQPITRNAAVIIRLYNTPSGATHYSTHTSITDGSSDTLGAQLSGTWRLCGAGLARRVN